MVQWLCTHTHALFFRESATFFLGKHCPLLAYIIELQTPSNGDKNQTCLPRDKDTEFLASLYASTFELLRSWTNFTWGRYPVRLIQLIDPLEAHPRPVLIDATNESGKGYAQKKSDTR
jgi:hypothetical protein